MPELNCDPPPNLGSYYKENQYGFRNKNGQIISSTDPLFPKGGAPTPNYMKMKKIVLGVCPKYLCIDPPLRRSGSVNAISVVDPGFPIESNFRGGGFTYYFAVLCWKLHENERIWIDQWIWTLDTGVSSDTSVWIKLKL